MDSRNTWVIHVQNTGERYNCSGKLNLLQGMLQLGRKGIPSGCHGGGCGVCKIIVVNREVDTLKMSRTHITPEGLEQGYALACRCFPRSDISLKVVGKMQKSVLLRR